MTGWSIHGTGIRPAPRTFTKTKINIQSSGFIMSRLKSAGIKKMDLTGIVLALKDFIALRDFKPLTRKLSPDLTLVVSMQSIEGKEPYVHIHAVRDKTSSTLMFMRPYRELAANTGWENSLLTALDTN